MARKRYDDLEILPLRREIEVHLHEDMDVVSACRIVLMPTRLAKKKRSIPSQLLQKMPFAFSSRGRSLVGNLAQ